MFRGYKRLAIEDFYRNVMRVAKREYRYSTQVGQLNRRYSEFEHELEKFLEEFQK